MCAPNFDVGTAPSTEAWAASIATARMSAMPQLGSIVTGASIAAVKVSVTCVGDLMPCWARRALSSAQCSGV